MFAVTSRRQFLAVHFVLFAVFYLSFLASAQTINITNGVQKYASLASTTVNMSGRCELWVTNASTPLSGCTINLNSTDSWLFLPGVKPSSVVSSYLGQVYVNGSAAVADSNVRVTQYGQYGAVVIPHSSSFQPLTVFSEPQFGGASNKYSQWTYYTGSGISRFSSFKLKRGYQAVLAQSADGKNYSKCYVAQDGDLEIGVLPATFDKQVQFIYVAPWRWTIKKGICPVATSAPGPLNALWYYDWNIDQSSSRDLEYVAIRQQPYWPSLSQNWQSLGINTVLGYNEPDNSVQDSYKNLNPPGSVSDAVSRLPDQLATGLRVGSPATTDGGVSSWLFPFIQQADAAGLRVDFVAQHYYQSHNPADAAGCASQMYNFLLNIWNNTHRPIWVTEWNNGANWTDGTWPAPTYAQQQACISAMINMLESTPFVERYALYNDVEVTRAVMTNGVLTGAGVVYSNLVSNLSYSQAMPDNGTRGIAQYVFATNTLDTSGYCNNGMTVGAPAYTTGHNSQVQAIVLDGANGYLQLPVNIARGTAFTFATWFYWNGGTTWQRIFDFGNDTSHYLFLTPNSGSGTLRFAINNGSGEQVLETSGLPGGTWQHVAVTISGSTVKLYTNGVLAASSTSFSITPASFSPIKNYIGKSQFSADPLFNGKLDEVEIADYAMTATQVSALYTTVQSPVPPYASGVWTQDANGNWGTSNNWSGGVIASGGNGVNYSADFSTLNITSDRTVTLDSARSIGGLKFGDTSGFQNWTLSGGNTLTLDTGSTNIPSIVVSQNSATISTPLTGSCGFEKSGGGTLILSGSNSPSGTVFIDTGSSSAAEGNVRAASPGSFANVSAVQIQDSGTGSSTFQLDGSAGNVSVASVALNGRNNSIPGIENIAGTNTLFGGINFNGGGNYVIQSDAGMLSVSSISGSSSGASLLTVLGSGTVAALGAVTDGSGGATTLVKTGAGNLVLKGPNTYSGETIVNQGTVALQPSAAPPVLHLTFDNIAGSSSGTTITNIGTGGSTMNGRIVGAGASIVSGGRFGNALSINGVGGTSATNIVLINNKALSTDVSNTWTVAYWIKTTTAGAVIMYQGDGTWSGSGQTTFLLNANSGSTAGTAAGAVRWAGGFLTGTAALNNGVWHLITLVDNGGTESIYVDGNVDAVTSTMALPLASGANQTWIGGAPDSDAGAIKMNGLIDEVYMFNRVLSQAEIQSLYNNNAVTNAPANVLPVSAPVCIGASGTLDVSGSSPLLAGLSGGGFVTNSGVPATLTISNSTGSSTVFGGNISDASTANAINFVQTGSGTTELAGTNSYHGSTTINQGALKLSPAADAVLHLTFDNAAGSSNGSVITNTGSAGAAMNGTIVGTGAVITSGGRFGNALSLNGVGGNAANNIVLVNSKVLKTDASASWSMGYWIKTTTAGAVIVYQGDGGWSSAGQTTYYLNAGNTSSGTHAGAVRWAGGWLTGSATLNDGSWHFVTLVDNAGTESIYVDGNVDSVTSTMGRPLAASANQTWIGGSPDGGDGTVKMSGLIDEVYIFDRALSSTEIQSLYNNNQLTQNSGPVLPIGTTVNIASGSKLDLGGVSPVAGSLTGSGSVANTGNAAATLTVSNSSGSTTFSGVIGDTSVASAVNLLKNGASTVTLTGANTYRGSTVVNNGALIVNGSIGTGPATVAGGIFGGNGIVNGPVTVQSGGTISPGNSIGLFTVNNNVTLQSGSTTSIEISHDAATNDSLVVSGTLNYGGTLFVTNLSGTLVIGDGFKLFNAGSYSGTFDSMTLPQLSTGLGWTFNPGSGTLTVMSTTSTAIGAAISGNALTLSWPSDHVGWRLQVQTNDLSAGLGTNWFDVPNSSATNQMILPMDNSNGSVFYRMVYP